MPQADDANNISRRKVLTGAVAAATAGAVMTGSAAVAGETRMMELLRLAKEQTDKLDALYNTPGDMPDEAFDPFYETLQPIEEQIIAMPSRSLEEMRGKARLVKWCGAEYPVDEPDRGSNQRLMLSIMRDLLET